MRPATTALRTISATVPSRQTFLGLLHANHLGTAERSFAVTLRRVRKSYRTQHTSRARDPELIRPSGGHNRLVRSEYAGQADRTFLRIPIAPRRRALR